MANDVEAEFAEFYRQHSTAMIRLAYVLTQSRPAAEDVVHDAFMRLQPRWSSLTDPAAYLRRAVVNGSSSYHRRRRREQSLPPTVVATIATEPDELRDAIARLPYRYRAAIVLRFYLDLSERGAAHLLGWRLGTMKSTTHRALARLRQEISP